MGTLAVSRYTTGKNLGARVVKDPSEPIKYFDNFLADLLDEELYCVGKVVTNRKEFQNLVNLDKCTG